MCLEMPSAYAKVCAMCVRVCEKNQRLRAYVEFQKGYMKYAQNAPCIEISMKYSFSTECRNFICN